MVVVTDLELAEPTREEEVLELVLLGVLSAALIKAEPDLAPAEATRRAGVQAFEVRSAALVDSTSVAWYLRRLGERVDAAGLSDEEATQLTLGMADSARAAVAARWGEV